METTVYNVKGQESGKINLPALFETKVSKALLHEVVTGYMANQRAGTHDTKTRGEVSGGGAKPYKQKGTGNARRGSNRSPLTRKGGIIFGPKPHGYYQNLPQQKKKLSLQMALSAKQKEGGIVVVDAMTIDEPKTKNVVAILKNLKLDGSTVLLIVDKLDPKLKIAGRNIPGLVLAEARNINTYQVLWARKMILTAAAVEQLINR